MRQNRHPTNYFVICFGPMFSHQPYPTNFFVNIEANRSNYFVVFANFICTRRSRTAAPMGHAVPGGYRWLPARRRRVPGISGVSPWRPWGWSHTESHRWSPPRPRCRWRHHPWRRSDPPAGAHRLSRRRPAAPGPMSCRGSSPRSPPASGSRRSVSASGSSGEP